MSETETLYVALDRSRLRVYQHLARTPSGGSAGSTVVESMDFPAGRASYSDTEADSAGRFPTAQGTGMSIDERLPLKQEHGRRIVREIAATLDRLLRAHPRATWHLAAGPDLLQAVLAELDPAVRRRLGSTIDKNLAQLSADELRVCFS